MTTDPSQALAWLKRLQAEDSWSMDFGASVRNVLPQLIGVVAECIKARDYITYESLSAAVHVDATLTALAEACAKEKG